MQVSNFLVDEYKKLLNQKKQKFLKRSSIIFYRFSRKKV